MGMGLFGECGQEKCIVSRRVALELHENDAVVFGTLRGVASTEAFLAIKGLISQVHAFTV